MGACHLPRLYVGHVHLEEVLRLVDVIGPASRPHGSLGMVHKQAVQTAEQVCQLELSL